MNAQHRTTAYLMANNALGAATGILFWVLVARFLGIGAAELGLGYVVVALGTAIGLVAKGGLDTAILRHVPRADGVEARRLVRFAAALGATVALVLAGAIAATSHVSGAFVELDGLAWGMIAAIASLLVVVWIQDAFFLAHGDAAATFRRNLVFSMGRILLPFPIVVLVLPQPISIAWLLALAASAVAGLALARRQPSPDGDTVPRGDFMRSAARNVAGSAAEFLPGLLLVPLVLATSGAAAAGHFGMAWTTASVLFLVAAAIGRSALSEMVQRGGSPPRQAVRRASVQAAFLLVPGVVGGILLARPVLWLFGPGYADAAAPAMMVLCASTLFVAPAYLYLAVLRAQERSLPLILFPTLLVAVLAIAAPALGYRFGLTGVAAAWLLANIPFGVYAALRLATIAKEVIHAPTPVGGHPHPE